jgi:hypothetical protein
MALPKVIHPTKKIHIPSLNIDAEFEPFTTADEKSIVLLDHDASLYDKARIQIDILEKCCKTQGINFHKLAAVEVSYLFLQLRKISVSGGLELSIQCSKCGESFPVTIDINSIKFDPTNLKEDKVLIDTSDGNYYIVFSQLRPDDLKDASPDGNSYDDAALVLRQMMRPDGNDVIDLTVDEKRELFSQLDLGTVTKIADYVNNCPNLSHHVEVVCPECGEKIEGELNDFFI